MLTAEKDYRNTTSDIEILGTKAFSKADGPNIRTMLVDKKLADDEDSGTDVGYFYNRLNELNQHKEFLNVKITDNRMDVFARLIDRKYNTLRDYLRGFSAGNNPEKKYQCYYYSERKQEVREFPLTLKIDDDGHVKANAEKFHDHADTILLTGTLKLIGTCLNIYLDYLEGNKRYFLTFSLHTQNYHDAGIRTFPPGKFLRGILTANSSYQGGYPITMECILVEASQREEMQNARRYLNLKSNSFHVAADPEEEESTQQLKINTKQIDSLGSLVNANYRIWRYGETPSSSLENREKVIFQSCIRMDKYSNGSIEVPLFPDKNQTARTELNHCRIMLNTLHTPRMLVLVYRGEALTTFTMSNIPPDKKGEMVQGVYCMESRLAKDLPTFGYFVMMEEKTPCEAKIIPINKIAQEIGSDDQLKKLKQMLDECPVF